MAVKLKVIKNTLVSGLARVITAITGFLLLPYMITKLGVEEFGLIGMCNLFLIGGYIGLLDFGLQTSITKYVAEYHSRGEKQKLNELINSVLWIFIGVGVAAMSLGLIMGDIVTTSVLAIPEAYVESFKTTLVLIFLSYLFGFPNIVFVSTIEGLQRFDILKGIQIVVSLGTAFGIFAVLHLGHGYMSVVVVTVVMSFIGFVSHFVAAFSCLPSLRLDYDFLSARILREISRMSGLVFTGRLVGQCNLRSERLLVGMFLGPAFMTSYEVIAKLPELIKSLLGVGHAAVMPAASELHAVNRSESLRKLLVEGWRFNLCFYVPVITGAIFFAGPFLEIWLGDEFGKLAGLTQTYLAQYIIFILVTYGFTLLGGMNKTLGEVTLVTFAATAIKIFAILSMIREFGLWGVVIGTLASMIIPLPFAIKIILQGFDLTLAFFLREIWSVLSLVVVPLIVSYSLGRVFQPQNIVVLIAGGLVWCASYWIALYIFVFNEENRILIKDLLRIKLFRLFLSSKQA